ncbi:MAG TPA: hypothetical protein VFX58_03935, partial [Chitinophagaceae bacterium]|nr:hypothetical protein [Chitinophagaceae bacterium]
MKHHTYLILIFSIFFLKTEGQIVTETNQPGAFSINEAAIYVDPNDHNAVLIAASLLQKDIEAVTGKRAAMVNTMPASGNIIVIGSADRSSAIQESSMQKKLNITAIKGKWDAY